MPAEAGTHTCTGTTVGLYSAVNVYGTTVTHLVTTVRVTAWPCKNYGVAIPTILYHISSPGPAPVSTFRVSDLVRLGYDILRRSVHSKYPP